MKRHTSLSRAAALLLAFAGPLSVLACEAGTTGQRACNSALDCPEGTWCSLSTRTCVSAPEVVTGEPDAGVDAAPSAGEDAATAVDVVVACAEGKACDDGDPCTHTDKCAGGACKGTAYSCDDGVACTTNVCNGQGGCDYGVAAGQCFIDGACVDAGPDPANACRTCVPALSQADWQDQTGQACDDGDPCTGDGTCQGGACTVGASQCDDGNPCTDDACDPEQGCVNAPNTIPCDDGDACTGPDACSEGACVGGDACLCTCELDTDCESAAVNPCVGGYFCLPGPEGCGTQCALDPSTAVVCDTSTDTECTKSECNPSTAACEPVTLPDGTPCDDGDPLTEDDECTAGECAGTSVCGCAGDADCPDDGDPCNGTFLCSACACVIDPATVVTCPTDGDTACMTSQCAPATGQCALTPVADGTPCDDDDPDTTGDVCTAGTCLGE